MESAADDVARMRFSAEKNPHANRKRPAYDPHTTHTPTAIQNVSADVSVRCTQVVSIT